METIQIKDVIIGDRFRDVTLLTDENLRDLLDDIPLNGLIQPIILNKNADGTVRLAAGGRRLTTLQRLGHTDLHHGTTCDPLRPGYVFANELPESQRRLIEISENRNRLDVGWRVEVHETSEYHRLKRNEARLRNEDWTQTDTGRALGGYSASYVSNCIQLDKVCDSTDFDDCNSITDALKILYRQKEDTAMTRLATFAPPVPKLVPSNLDVLLIDDDTDSTEDVDIRPADEKEISLSNMLFLGDSIRAVLPNWPAECIDHAIFDAPYAIDIGMMQQASGGLLDASRIEATHDVAENEDLLTIMWPELYRVLKPTAFCITFCDIMQWQRLYDAATSAGFRVQRWPFVWCKTSSCMNQSAHLNATKNIELAIIARKDKAQIGRPFQTSYLECGRDSNVSNPFAKPYELWKTLIEAFTLQGQTILDCCAGEGSSTLATLKTNRRPFAIEKDPRHFPYLVENVKTYYKGLYKNPKFV